MKTYWGNEGIVPRILNLALDGGEWSTSRYGRFNSLKRVLGTHWIGGWMGSRAGLDTEVKRKIPRPLDH
jgi:hypothetical protein